MQSKTKVIVVEDDMAIRKMYEMKLKNNDYDVEVAVDGQTGLELADKFRPNLILLDLRMPYMNGDEMLQRLRAKDWGSEIRVVVLTNISKNEAPHSLRMLNVDRYIVKAHSTPSQVLEIVEEVLGKQKAKVA